jgi:hypothetical protein
MPSKHYTNQNNHIFTHPSMSKHSEFQKLEYLLNSPEIAPSKYSPSLANKILLVVKRFHDYYEEDTSHGAEVMFGEMHGYTGYC